MFIKELFRSKALCLTVLFLIILGACSIQNTLSKNSSKTDFRVATYNIRYDAAADKTSGNDWKTRKEYVAKLILKYEMDIVGTQEGNQQQLSDLQALIPDYKFDAYPYGGKDGNLHNAAIYYKSSLFKLMDAGVFWLSETPDEPSIGWDASDRRICQWGKFRHIPSDHVFYFFNAHFYWRGWEAKEASGEVMVRKINEIAGAYPVMVVGDFNSEVKTLQIQTIKTSLNDAYDISINGRKGIEGTAFPGGVFQGIPNVRIDYIFLSKENYEVSNYHVISDVYDRDRFPSDHLPVICDISLLTRSLLFSETPTTPQY